MIGIIYKSILGGSVKPDGDWILTFDKDWYDENLGKYIDNIVDIIIIPTIKGTVRWDS